MAKRKLKPCIELAPFKNRKDAIEKEYRPKEGPKLKACGPDSRPGPIHKKVLISKAFRARRAKVFKEARAAARDGVNKKKIKQLEQELKEMNRRIQQGRKEDEEEEYVPEKKQKKSQKKSSAVAAAGKRKTKKPKKFVPFRTRKEMEEAKKLEELP